MDNSVENVSPRVYAPDGLRERKIINLEGLELRFHDFGDLRDTRVSFSGGFWITGEGDGSGTVRFLEDLRRLVDRHRI